MDTVDQARATWQRTGLDVLVTPEGVETDKTSGYPGLIPTEVEK